MKNQDFPQQCPAPEELSAFYDGECQNTAIGAHIAHCESCRRKIGDFAALDRMLSAQYDCAAETLPQQILSLCAKDSEEHSADAPMQRIPGGEKKYFTFARIVMRHAAVIAVTAAASTLMTYALFRQTGTAGSATPAAWQSTAHVPQNAGYSLADSLRDRQARPDPRNPVLTHNEIGNVSLDSSASSHPAAAAGEKFLLPDVVSHVWIVDDAALTAPPAMKGFHWQTVGTPDPAGGTTYTVTATDIQLQKLVDALHRRPGWSLASPALPQPEGSAQLLFRRQPVKYLLTLVPRG